MVESRATANLSLDGDVFPEYALGKQVLKEGGQLHVSLGSDDSVEVGRDPVKPVRLLLGWIGGPVRLGKYWRGAEALAGIRLIDGKANDRRDVLGREFEKDAHPLAMQLDEKDWDVSELRGLGL